VSSKRNRAAAALLATALITSVGPAASAADTLPPAGSSGASTPWQPISSSTAMGPSADGVQSQIDKLARDKDLRRSSVIVMDPGTDAVLYDKQGARALIPASTLKILTAAAALEALGPTTRLATTTSAVGDVVYLVGGGDSTLARKSKQDSDPNGPATLRRLAWDTALALRGNTSVDIIFDDSLFEGRTLGPGWPKGFPAAGVVAPVTALMIDQGRKKASARARVADPSVQAARAFANYLEKKGIKVRSVKRGKAPENAAELARVESQTVTGIVQDMLTDSDNDVAESLGHLAGGALVGEASFSGGSRAIAQVLQSAGIDTQGLDLSDASGLSGRNRVSPMTVAQVLTDVVREERWTPISAGLAVAGVSGTLANRFATKATRAGRGVVRAKTGTLTGVGSLAGIVVDEQDHPLVFAIISNRVRSQARARDTMDRIASNLAECGCR